MANYTKLENDIFDFLYSVNISGAELQVLLYLIRITKGFHRTTAKAAYKYIAQGTGLSVPTVKRAMLKFMKAGIISEEYPPNGTSERMVRLEWSNLIRGRINSDPKSYQIRDHIRIRTDHQEIKEEIKEKKEKNKKGSDEPILPFYIPRVPYEELNPVHQEMYRRWKSEHEEWEKNNS